MKKIINISIIFFILLFIFFEIRDSSDIFYIDYNNPYTYYYGMGSVYYIDFILQICQMIYRIGFIILLVDNLTNKNSNFSKNIFKISLIASILFDIIDFIFKEISFDFVEGTLFGLFFYLTKICWTITIIMNSNRYKNIFLIITTAMLDILLINQIDFSFGENLNYIGIIFIYTCIGIYLLKNNEQDKLHLY